MYNFLLKYGQLAAFGLGLIITLLFYISVFSSLDAFNAMAEEQQPSTSIFNIGLGGAILLIILCVAAMLIFGVYYIITHPKQARRGLLGLALLIAIFAVSYFTSDPEASGSLGKTLEEFDITPGVSKYVSGALKTTLILGIIAILSFVYSEVSNFFK